MSLLASSADAALANGTAIHGFEIDDAHITSSLHPGAVTLPASLAVGEEIEAREPGLLTSIGKLLIGNANDAVHSIGSNVGCYDSRDHGFS